MPTADRKLSLAARDRTLLRFDRAASTSRPYSVVTVDTRTLQAQAFSGEEAEALKGSRPWRPLGHLAKSVDPLVMEIAEAELSASTRSKPQTLSALSRKYTVPPRVAALAKAALAARDELLLNPEALIAAALLASDEQVSPSTLLFLHKFFEANPSEPMSSLRASAFGGEAGASWARSLVSKLPWDAITASVPEGDDRLSFFDEESGTEVFGLVDLKTGKVRALLDNQGQVMCQGKWELVPREDFDPAAIYTPESLTPLDPESALFVAASLFDAPDTPVDLSFLHPEEAEVVRAAAGGLDNVFLDRLIAAAPPGEGYTSEERGKNADSQLRDGTGRFAKVGDTGAVKSTGIAGQIAAVKPEDGQLLIAGDDGKKYLIAATDFEIGAEAHPPPDPQAAQANAPSYDGILGEAPQTDTDTEPKARLEEEPTLLSPAEIAAEIDGYEEEVTRQRQERALQFVEKVVNAAAEEAPAGQEVLTPGTSDVPPIYFAIVDPEDTRAVLDLIALCPASSSASDAATFKRAAGKWLPAPEVLQDLRSPTPPAVVKLDEADYKSVIAQVDTTGSTAVEKSGDGSAPMAASAERLAPLLSLAAAGGADRNRGGAETLRRYWTTGEGGAKIRWNTPGDWKRCVSQLSKYLGVRSKGYCALRHHEVTGMWPGDRKNRTASGAFDVMSSGAVIRSSAYEAELNAALAKINGDPYLPKLTTAEEIKGGRVGRAFKIPIVVPEGISSGDTRIFHRGSLGLRTFPLPLLWQPFTGEGHDKAVIVGRIDHVERIDGGLGNAYGVMDVGAYGKEAERLIEALMLRWISVDLDKFEENELANEYELDGKMHIKKGRMMAATLVAKPAFQECTIELLPILEPEEEAMALTASLSIAASIPVEPPSEWFGDPALAYPTPINVTDDGRVFGHIATWGTRHVGLPGNVPPPRSRTGYAYFHTGVVRTSDGQDVKVGQLTLAGGHAPLHADASAAARHYDDTASAIADVHAGEDAHGIWVAGALRPDATPAKIRALRASAPSGDWRSINGGPLEMIAVCQVNVPGFPVPRSLAASAASEYPNALVAAGSAELFELRALENQKILEPDFAAVAAAASARVYLALGADGYLREFKDFSADRLQKLVSEKKALPSGAFPIESAADLRRAIGAESLGHDFDPSQVRRHIVRRARELEKPELIPSDWPEAGMAASALNVRDRYQAVIAAAREQREAERLSLVAGAAQARMRMMSLSK